jgi:hypothetical protein
MRCLLLLTLLAFVSLIGVGLPAQAASQMSAFFQISASHLVHQRAYYRGGQAGPACTAHIPRDHGCTGRSGVVVWR